MKRCSIFLIAAWGLVVLISGCGVNSRPQDFSLEQAPTTGTPTSISTPVPIGTVSTIPLPTIASTLPTVTPATDPGYGGHYIDPADNSIVHIFMMHPSQEGAERLGKTRIGSVVYDGTRKVKEVRPVQGQYTYQQLYQWNGNLIQTELGKIPEVTSWGVDEGSNRITVGVNCESSRDQVVQNLPSLLSGSEMPPEAIEVYVGGIVAPPGATNRFECAPREIGDPATGTSSPGFGGLFLDKATRTTNVFMLEPAQEEAEELALEILGSETLQSYPNIRVIEAQYTWEQIIGWHDEWRDALKSSSLHLPDGVRFVNSPFADPSINRLMVRLNHDWTPEIVGVVEDWMNRTGIPREAVVFSDPTSR